MRRQSIAFWAAILLPGAFVVANCTAERSGNDGDDDDADDDGDDDNGDARGGSGGSRGGTGGTRSGGSGGTGGGKAGNGGGGNAGEGGDGGGGMAGEDGMAGTGGMGGMAGMVASDPFTFGFESGTQGWINGVSHFGADATEQQITDTETEFLSHMGDDPTGMDAHVCAGKTEADCLVAARKSLFAQCAHGRLAIAEPTVSTDDKLSGNSSLKYEISISEQVKQQYQDLCKTSSRSFATIVANEGLGVGLAMAGAPTGLLPVGSEITLHLKMEPAAGNIQMYTLANSVPWTAGVQSGTSNGWTKYTLVATQALQYPGFGWLELGLLFNNIPETYNGVLYIDDVTIKPAD
jgi:hypothetical protein